MAYLRQSRTGSDATESIRAFNRARVLRLLYERGTEARFAIAEILGLTPASVSRIVAECIEAGLIEETETETGSEEMGVGRRPIPVSLNPVRYVVGAVHIGVFWVDVGIMNLQGAMVMHERRSRWTADPRDLIVGVCEMLRGLSARGMVHTLGIGVTLNAQVDQGQGLVMGYNALGWRNIPVKAWVQEELGLYTVVDTNVYAMALAEALRNPPPTDQPLLLLNVGSTIGLAMVVNQRVVRGFQNLSGFLELMRWPFEDPAVQLADLISDRVLLKQVASLASTPSPKRIEEVMDEARHQPLFDKILRQRARSVGTLLAYLAVLYDPARLCVSGSWNDTYFEEVQKSYWQRLGDGGGPWIVPDRPVEIPGVPIHVRGAGTLALQEVFSPVMQIEWPGQKGQPARAYLPIQVPKNG